MKLTIALYTVLSVAVSAHKKDYGVTPTYSSGVAYPSVYAAPLTVYRAAPIQQQVVIPTISYANQYAGVPYTAKHTKDHYSTHKTVKHSLVPVQIPAQQQLVVPSVIATRPQFTAERARMGKVVDRSETTYFCKTPGFILEGETCVQILSEAPKYVCPGGYESVGGGCERRAQILSICPAGYTQRDGGCQKLVSAALISSCPADSYQTTDGGCERQVAHPLTPTCPEGTYSPATGQCCISTTADARAYCPEGFAFTDGSCLQEEVYDCTDVQRQVSVQAQPRLAAIQRQPIQIQAQPVILQAQPVAAPKVHVKHEHGHKYRRLSAKECATPCQPTQVAACIAERVVACEQPVAPQVVMPPVTSTITVQKTCTRVTSTGLIFACDEGTLSGTRCIIPNTMPPTPICTAEGGVQDCHVRQRVAPLFDCPTDYTKQCPPGARCQCIAYESIAQSYRCPSGFEGLGDSCVRTAEARAVCPPGYTLDGTTCLRTLREPADCQFQVTYECDRLTGDCTPPPRPVAAVYETPIMYDAPVGKVHYKKH